MQHPLLVIFVVILSATASNAQSNAITTTTLDLKKDRHGNAQVRYETTLRGGNRILLVRYERDTSGNFVPRSRAYYFGHTMVMVEGDDDRDGFFETLVLFDHSGGEERTEAFIRSPDGSVRPVDTEELERIKKVGPFWEDFWKQALPPK